MTSRQLLLEGVEITLFGIVLVYVFLVLLIFFIRFVSRTVQRFAPVQTAGLAVPAKPVPLSLAVPDADTLAAIQAAIKQHRSNQHK